MGKKPARSYTLDKIDPNNPEYSPGICRWASKKLQTSNRRNTRYLVDHSGIRLSAAEWSRRTGIPNKTILSRLDRGDWSEHEAIHTPVGQPRKSKEAKFSNPETAARTTEAIALWRQILRDKHGQEFYSATKKDAGLLKQLLGRVEAESPGNSTDILERVLTEWGAFCLYAKSNYGAYEPPLVPSVEYLAKYCNAAGNWYLRQLQRDEEWQSQEVRQTQREKERQHDEHRESFIQDYLNANDEYRQKSQLLEAFQLEKDDQIEELVTDQMREDFRGSLWALLCGGSNGNGSLDPEDSYGAPARVIAKQYLIANPNELPMLKRILRKEAELSYAEKYPQNRGVNQQL
jgi:hypothetical protein